VLAFKGCTQGIFPPAFFAFFCLDLPVVHRTASAAGFWALSRGIARGAIGKYGTLPFLRPFVKPATNERDNTRTVEENFHPGS
jgi:hypothetical protein